MNTPQWYVVLTKPKQEQLAAERLQQQGGEVFLPLFEVERMYKGKRCKRQEPLFPGYLFLQTHADSGLLSKVRSTIGARQLLTFGNQPVTVNDLLINDLRQRCGVIHNVPLFKSGQKVSLREGPFRNYEAIFKEYDGNERAIILLGLLGQQNELVVELSELGEP
ncbi:transcription/translation regulatory transformer protein RfaH [Venatoribacter cucullus]|uniref:Transcription/translation regulatory transformer protein RfaH n=1 Tax=Venatoribacter cucullus TaxID=2661630 RepID=A0A9X7YMN0_9GAMM|nr:transcription/translation regulatory transformer protein RfaH [Venatoribacter cucullus]QQD23700.1 transcription/translation regulatory transformer protein RfaH [Venatoribacter cucullus]